MPIEYSANQLAKLLQADLERFEISHARGGWRARDDAADEIHRGASYEELLILIALKSEILDLADRPTINCCPVLISEVAGSTGDWIWRAVDLSGRTHFAPQSEPDRDSALLSLNNHYD